MTENANDHKYTIHMEGEDEEGCRIQFLFVFNRNADHLDSNLSMLQSMQGVRISKITVKEPIPEVFRKWQAAVANDLTMLGFDAWREKYYKEGES